MKKRFKQVVSKVSAVTLALCMAFSGVEGFTTFSKNAGTVTANAAGTDYGLIGNVQDATILHCWNWSYKTIEENMELIAQCGYSVIQTSPCTQGKDYAWEGVIDTCVGWPKLFGQGNWWKLYQPVAECVCDNGMSYLGTKAELKSMCDAAEQYGIKVVVDIVANHMANVKGWKNELSDISPEVGTYWDPDMLVNEEYWHINQYQVWMSDGRKDFTQGTMGMPDLNTANKKVQKFIYEYLDELIDCGVDGFRFDAAKHIETPDDDASYASDFWPTVLNEARSHYKSVNGGDLYVYGEVLNTVGDGFDISSYTKYMSVTDNAAGNGFLDAVRNCNAGNISQHYASDKSVIWAESHDTYMNESSVYASDRSIVRAWAILANKDNAAKLFFVRPYDSADILNNDADNNIKSNDDIGEQGPAIMGECNTYVWCSKEVAAINHFNNRFSGTADNIGCEGNVMYCQRGNGIVLASFNGAGSVSISAHGMADGTYKDEVSGSTFTVSGGTLSGTIGSDMGIAVVYQNVMPNPTAAKKPWVAASKGDGSKFAANSLEVSLVAKNCTSATYSLSTGESGTISGSTKIVIGKNLAVGQSVVLTLTGTGSAGTVTRKYTYTKTDAPEVAVTGVTVSKSKLSIAPGDTATLTANVAPADASNTNVTWSSSDSSVASVSNTGVVSAKKNGTAVITVTTEDGGFKATCSVTVTDNPQPTTGTVYFKNTNNWASPCVYMWNSSTKVNNGWPGVPMTKTSDSSVYAYEYGVDSEYNMAIFTNAGASQTADLTFAGDGYIYDPGTGKWSVYGGGEEVKVTGVSLNKTTATVNVNGTTTLSATVAPSNATNKNVTWSSSNTSVAKVSNSGVVTAVAKGSAVITVKTTDGGYTATCSVTVNEVVVTEGWKKDSKGWYYVNADGTYVKSAWKKIDGKWYHFDASGYMQTGWYKEGSTYYYLKSNGVLASDEWVENDKYYIDANGKWVQGKTKYTEGWKKDSKGWWYQNADGTYVKNAWKKISNKWYRFGSDGYMVTGWYKEGSTYYYLKSNGVLASDEWVENDKYYIDANGKWVQGKTKYEEGWKQDSKGWWYQNADGTYVKNAWKQINGKWYHFDKNGYMQTGWYQEGSNYYYLKSNGVMATDEWVDGGKYYVNSKGIWVK